MSAMRIRARALKELEDRYGKITAEKLVEAARDRRHPLHNDFVWDDKKAAHENRLNTARNIINSTRFIVTHSKKTISTVAYVRDPSAAPDKQGYVSVSRLRTDREAAEEALVQEVSQIAARLERARELAAVLNLEAELNAALEAAMTLKSRLRRGPNIAEDRIGA